MDVVASLREQYGADVVHLFGSSGTSLAGMATGSPSERHAVLMGGSTTILVHAFGS
ncbi:MAG: hypothetical protein H0W20_14100 [Chthoniobacterales bacterium]|nr:hypothetical protein [Chthoniobacterales bacterium]